MVQELIKNPFWELIAKSIKRFILNLIYEGNFLVLSFFVRDAENPFRWILFWIYNFNAAFQIINVWKVVKSLKIVTGWYFIGKLFYNI